MKHQNEKCIVSILADSTYSVQSTDNRHYDIELNPENLTQGDWYDALSIHVDLFSKEYDIVLVNKSSLGLFFSSVLNDEVLTIMRGNSISQINIITGEQILFKKFETYGDTFELYTIPDGYIVWGEMEIIRLSLSFDIVWSFMGQDIFVSQTDAPAFELGEGSIKLHDWEGNDYELDFEGNLIN